MTPLVFIPGSYCTFSFADNSQRNRYLYSQSTLSFVLVVKFVIDSLDAFLFNTTIGLQKYVYKHWLAEAS